MKPTIWIDGVAHGINMRKVRGNTYEGVLILPDRWVWMAYRSDGVVTSLWAHLGYGGLRCSDPLIERKSTIVGPGSIVLDKAHGNALNGQGTTLRCWYYYEAEEFAQIHPLHLNAPMDSTRFSPADPTQTGVWDYMGRGKQLGDITYGQTQHELYAHGRYPGQFMHHDGRPVIDKDVPGSVLYNGAHFHKSATRSWINYTDPKNPWRDHGARDQHGDRIHAPDDQHMTLTYALCEAAVAHPEDEGFRHLLKMAAGRYLLQVPGAPSPNGFMVWPGSARARGRVVMTGLKMAEVFHLLGEPRACGLVLARASERIAMQIEVWNRDLIAKLNPIPTWSGAMRSPNECGIWFSALQKAHAIAKYLSAPTDGLEMMMEGLAKYCFDSFRRWPDGRWSVPYFTGAAESPRTSPTFAWLAAVAHETKDAEKMAAIRQVGESIDRRFK